MSLISEQITGKHGEEYLLRQLSEECGELTQACLKLVRAWKKETPVSERQCREQLVEEMADVLLMQRFVRDELLTGEESMKITEIMRDKEVRMYRRMILGEVGA